MTGANDPPRAGRTPAYVSTFHPALLPDLHLCRLELLTATPRHWIVSNSHGGAGDPWDFVRPWRGRGR